MENTKTTKKTTTSAACKKTTKVASSTTKTATCAAKKGCGCKKIATSTDTSSCKTSNAKVFPTEYLNSWLQNRYSWNHNDWLGLLSELSSKGYSYYAETAEGQTIVGNYIETNRWR